MLADIEDVEKRLGRGFDQDETLRVEGLLEEASFLVEAHVGKAFDVIPDTVRIVVSRMVARVLNSPTDGIGTESSSYSAGQFSKNVTYTAGASGGSPWLTAVDKKMLRAFGGRSGGVYSIKLC